MPALSVKLSMQECVMDDAPKSPKPISFPHQPDESVLVHMERDYTMNVKMQRKNRSSGLKVHCPLYHKGKQEGWFLVLGNGRELLALKRVAAINNNRRSIPLQLQIPQQRGKYYFIQKTIFFSCDFNYL